MANNLTLLELNGLVREVLETTLDEEYWVEAEVASVREVKGHCYLELIQKDERSNTPVAQASAKCWRSTWMLLRPRFERVTGRQLQAGMKLLLQVYANFHEAYGFSWIVTDINPEFTMGDMARRRREIIRRLHEQGIFDMQRELSLPAFAQRIAVVSSEGAAGYGDFCHQIESNGYGLRFSVTLFPAVMQGETVEESVVAALDRIARKSDDYDVVVIIRGGGATSDLTGFDTLRLAENVCNFPLPIITGIGHERDESILDLVAWRSVKTPTAAAAFLVDHLQEVAVFLDEAAERIARHVGRQMQSEKTRLQRLAASLQPIAQLSLKRHSQRLETISLSLSPNAKMMIQHRRQSLDRLFSLLPPLSKIYVQRCEQKVDNLAVRIKASDPQTILKRGYSITTFEGKIVRNAKDLKSGQEIETQLAQGRIKSITK
ncbi:MAG: exodeoxyribonuclease VII large subunit [Prevotella sp.]|nr:exodeoxyribonuclease VII large subunit [Prevotella sp.]